MKSIIGITDISGFGKDTSYEKCCQKMLQVGYEWLENNKDKLKRLKGHTYKNVYGIFEPDSKEAKELSKVIVKGVDCTGAMHQAVMGHLFYISRNGLDKWKEEVK